MSQSPIISSVNQKNRFFFTLKMNTFLFLFCIFLSFCAVTLRGAVVSGYTKSYPSCILQTIHLHIKSKFTVFLLLYFIYLFTRIDFSFSVPGLSVPGQEADTLRRRGRTQTQKTLFYNLPQHSKNNIIYRYSVLKQM